MVELFEELGVFYFSPLEDMVPPVLKLPFKRGSLRKGRGEIGLINYRGDLLQNVMGEKGKRHLQIRACNMFLRLYRSSRKLRYGYKKARIMNAHRWSLFTI